MSSEAVQATRLLQRLCEGDRDAAGELVPLVYTQLRGLADQLMRGEPGGHTLQPTALVHEAYQKLIARHDAGIDNRKHFFRIAARAMREVLVDHARGKRRQKRGGGAGRVPLDDAVELLEERAVDLLDLDESLERLEAVDAQLARIVELRFFAGMTIEETADSLEVSTPTVERRWRVARAFLRNAMSGSRSG